MNDHDFWLSKCTNKFCTNENGKYSAGLSGKKFGLWAKSISENIDARFGNKLPWKAYLIDTMIDVSLYP